MLFPQVLFQNHNAGTRVLLSAVDVAFGAVGLVRLAQSTLYPVLLFDVLDDFAFRLQEAITIFTVRHVWR